MQRREALLHVGAMTIVAPAPAVRAEGSGAALTPQDFGAVGDGQADDTGALQRMLDRARETGAEAHLSPGVYAISEYLRVRNGLRAILGRGGVIRCVESRQNAGLLLAGVALGERDNVRGLRIEGLVIDAALRERPVNAIHGQNCLDCRIAGNRVVNLRAGSGVLIQSQQAGRQAAADNLIEDNVIEGVAGQSGTQWWGIVLSAQRSFVPPARDQDEQWKAHFIAADAPLPITGHVVRGNRISGGYYGIWLMAARNCRVQDNHTADNVRNISVSDCSLDNLVSGNQCQESLSSAIHLAYGSRRNRINGNRIATARAQGEGLLQAYIGVEENLFMDNEVDATGRPQYLIYCAIHADRNEFRGNQLKGTASRACIALESAWRWTLLNPAHYGFLKGPGNIRFARAGSTDNRFVGNVIDNWGDAPAIFLAQVGGAETALTGTVLAGNRVAGNPRTRQLELLEETEGQLRGLSLSGNRFAAGAQATQFVLPRGLDHCVEARGNGALDRWLGTR
ncbi:MAG: right-handed parallel beta-helix repeat-containing protein [Rubrivivax sp.]|nr:right-handed parallel beta-helix repeat-containing protein [Rubrivivax sp.]